MKKLIFAAILIIALFVGCGSQTTPQVKAESPSNLTLVGTTNSERDTIYTYVDKTNNKVIYLAASKQGHASAITCADINTTK